MSWIYEWKTATNPVQMQKHYVITLALIVYFLDHSLIIHLKRMTSEHNHVHLVGIQHVL